MMSFILTLVSRKTDTPGCKRVFSVSEVWERVCINGKKWRPIRSLTASLTGKTVDLDHVSLIRSLVDAWGSLR